MIAMTETAKLLRHFSLKPNKPKGSKFLVQTLSVRKMSAEGGISEIS